jgi:hypothetical protein
VVRLNAQRLWRKDARNGVLVRVPGWAPPCLKATLSSLKGACSERVVRRRLPVDHPSDAHVAPHCQGGNGVRRCHHEFVIKASSPVPDELFIKPEPTFREYCGSEGDELVEVAEEIAPFLVLAQGG